MIIIGLFFLSVLRKYLNNYLSSSLILFPLLNSLKAYHWLDFKQLLFYNPRLWFFLHKPLFGHGRDLFSRLPKTIRLISATSLIFQWFESLSLMGFKQLLFYTPLIVNFYCTRYGHQPIVRWTQYRLFLDYQEPFP